MATEIRMPKLGLTMTSGTVHNWLKKEGEAVQVGESLVEISTDKLSTDVESDAAGILRVIVAGEGEEVPVLGLLGIVGTADEEIVVPGDDAPPESTDTVPTVADASRTSAVSSVSAAHGPGGKSRIKASPLAKKTAAEKGVDLSRVSGTGPDGRIRREDVLAALEKGPAETVTGRVRRTVTAGAKGAGVPHGRLRTEVVLDKALALRDALNSGVRTDETQISFLGLLLKVVAAGLVRVPEMNGSLEGDEFTLHDDVNIGLALESAEGGAIPVIANADRKGLRALSEEAADLASRAEMNALTGEERMRSAVCVAGLDTYEVDAFTPDIQPQHCAGLGFGRIIQKPVVNASGAVVAASTMVLTLSFERRIVEQAQAAKLITHMKQALENPYLLIGSHQPAI